MDFNKLTLKSQEAVAAAQELARRRGNPEIHREHLLQRLAGRVPGARVVPRLRLADRRLRVRRGLVDRDVHRAVLGIGVLADVDRPRLEPHRVLAHGA